MAMPDQLYERLATALRQAGCTALFGLPGGGPNLDVVGAALQEGIEFVLAHGETEAAIMAGTYGLLTGTPGAVVATRGPGATSLANGVAQATLDRFPLVAITDTVPAAQSSRVAHQRIDQRSFFAPISKTSATIGQHASVQHLTELINESTLWPYGTVHLDYDPTDTTPRSAGPRNRAVREPSTEDISAATDLLARAATPVVVVGAEAVPHAAALRPLLERAGAPVLTTYRAVGAVPTEGFLNAGLFTNGKLESAVLGDADLIVTVGLDLVEPIPRRWGYDAPVIRVSAVDQVDDYLPATVDLVGAIESTCKKLFARVTTGAGRIQPDVRNRRTRSGASRDPPMRHRSFRADDARRCCGERTSSRPHRHDRCRGALSCGDAALERRPAEQAADLEWAGHHGYSRYRRRSGPQLPLPDAT